jgi:arylsulfatase A-like enzyme
MKNQSALLFLPLMAACGDGQEKTPEQPNIVVLFVDDLGYYDVGFRNSEYHTPNIDQLATEGKVLNNSYVPSPCCSPSRAGLYTGQHPARLEFFRHIPGNVQDEYHAWEGDTSLLLSRNWLPLETVTYAEVVKKNGYNTFFAGKWHLGNDYNKFGPGKQGFDIAITQGVNTRRNDPARKYANHYGQFDEIPDGQYPTDYYTDKVVEYIETYDSEKPFLVQLSYHDVHTPTVGREDFFQMYREKGFEGELIIYGAQVSAVDESVGRVLDALQRSGMVENTLVILTSDQGSYFPNLPLRGTKAVGTTLYEGGQKVPFIVKWPGRIDEGSYTDVHVQTSDIFPTICQVVNDDPDNYEGLEGLSLLGLLTDGEPLNREAIIAFRSYDAQYASVLRHDNWKIIAYRDGRFELYKVDEDISEENDLAAQHPQIVRELAQMLKAWEQDTGIPF